MVYPGYERKVLFASFLVIVSALHALSFTNVFGGTLPGAEWDARTFHQQAARLAEAGAWPQLSIGSQLYEYILAGAYRVFGAHILVGQSLSVLAATLTLMVINATAVNLGAVDSRVRAGVILVAGLYPTFLYHNALTFREPYELLGLALGVFFVLKAIEETKPAWIAGAVLSFLFMGMFHHILLGIGVVLLCIFVLLLYAPGLKSKRNYVVVTALIAMISGLGYAAITSIPVATENDYVKKIRQERGIVGAIVQYRSTIEARMPRTSYDLDIDASSGAGIAKGAAYNYWNYLARPFATDLEVAADSVPFLSAAVRVVLIVILLGLVLGGRLADRRMAFCACTYIVVTLVWSLGTTNYGQAFRHHALTDWLLVLMAGYAVHRKLAGSDGMLGNG